MGTFPVAMTCFVTIQHAPGGSVANRASSRVRRRCRGAWSRTRMRPSRWASDRSAGTHSRCRVPPRASGSVARWWTGPAPPRVTEYQLVSRNCGGYAPQQPHRHRCAPPDDGVRHAGQRQATSAPDQTGAPELATTETATESATAPTETELATDPAVALRRLTASSCSPSCLPTPM